MRQVSNDSLDVPGRQISVCNALLGEMIHSPRDLVCHHHQVLSGEQLQKGRRIIGWMDGQEVSVALLI